MIDPTDFCPGCNSLRCTCEEDERAAIRETDQSRDHLEIARDLRFSVETIRQILSQFTQEYGD